VHVLTGVAMLTDAVAAAERAEDLGALQQKIDTAQAAQLERTGSALAVTIHRSF
jgi:hypothetical protein